MAPKRLIGITLCIFFGLDLLADVFVYIVNTFGLHNPTVVFIFWSMIELAKCGILIFAGTQSQFFTYNTARICASALGALYGFLALNLIYSLIFKSSLLASLMGDYSFVYIDGMIFILGIAMLWG